MNKNRGLLRRIWNRLFDQLLAEADAEHRRTAEDPAATERAIGIRMVWDQIWDALNERATAASEWAWPVDVYWDEDGSLFCIVAQGGKLYRIALSLVDGAVQLGEWVQVEEVFEPVQQGAFCVRRQADGRHRWLMIAATSVLNRVAEIDSVTLFDSFIRRAEESGRYPRLDFYHLGSADPDVWEFGTADYLARDGVCYIASGLFDEDHPLAKATIRAAQREPDRWGASIEFLPLVEPELIAIDPEVRVPMYTEGENTRITVALEEDVASLFTRLSVSREVTRMNLKIRDKLKELFGGDDAALEEFIDTFGESVDEVNRTVTEQGLIHRQKRDAGSEDQDETDAGDEEGEGGEGRSEVIDIPEIVLDDEAMRQLAAQVVDSEAMTSVLTPVLQAAEAMRAAVSVINDLKGIVEQQNKVIRAQGEQLELLLREDEEKQREWLEDLPPRRQTKVTYRPRDAKRGSEEQDEEIDLRTQLDKELQKLPSY